MKRAFTLIEMLIVVAIMATLMTVVFRLASVTSADQARITTVTRMQKLENCLSGYYAAFGSYPPVAVHGTRDIYRVLQDGVQTDQRNTTLSWEQVEAACRSQPVTCNFPFPEGMSDQIKAYADEIKDRTTSGRYKKYAQSAQAGIFTAGFGTARAKDFPGDLWNDSEWRQVQIFRFGLMSYLLPRLLVMTGGDPLFYGSGGDPCTQWSENNDAPCAADNGQVMTWQEALDAVQPDTDYSQKNKTDYLRVANMPTQAVCARWLPNLEGICSAWHSVSVFGIELKGESSGSFYLDSDEDSAPPTLEIFSNGNNYYILDSISVQDGWNRDFYYYSPAGNQSYALWSAGANGKTFPPWISLPTLNTSDRETVGTWIADDLRGMNH